MRAADQLRVTTDAIGMGLIVLCLLLNLPALRRPSKGVILVDGTGKKRLPLVATAIDQNGALDGLAAGRSEWPPVAALHVSCDATTLHLSSEET
mmetsp:Transcript_50601/g.126886  ORF Transcript_50601/g.126886 Transcript_50601/m.126886 type:complete len:94 (-) Transcript_50601:1190-1471(-)